MAADTKKTESTMGGRCLFDGGREGDGGKNFEKKEEALASCTAIGYNRIKVKDSQSQTGLGEVDVETMRNISDVIEDYLKKILEESKKGYIEIQRNELADKFQCVPSQINYVINTRFTIEKGYVVESKRGGGGYIRIRKVNVVDEQRFLQRLLNLIDQDISQTSAENIIDRLVELELVTDRESRLMKAVIQRRVLPFEVGVRDRLRANLLKAMIHALMYQ